jgi:hypothetical protein
MAFLDWIEAVPRWVKIPFAVAGFLLSAFSSRLPEALQDIGLKLGLILLVGGILALCLHGIRDQFGGKKKRPVTDSIDERSKELAGLVSALLEGALDWSFKLPREPGDLWLTRYYELRDSAHPVWSNQKIAILRRDFLHHCAIVGDQSVTRDAKEFLADRNTLDISGRRLMAALKGEDYQSN